MYHNTTNLTGNWLLSEMEKAKSQEDRLMVLFSNYPQMSSGTAVQYFPRNTPLTSVRRAMTNLMKQGKIVKTEMTIPGKYGKPETIYRKKEAQMTIVFPSKLNLPY